MTTSGKQQRTVVEVRRRPLLALVNGTAIVKVLIWEERVRYSDGTERTTTVEPPEDKQWPRPDATAR